MLKAANRLRHRRDIDRVYKQGKYGAGEGQLSIKAARTGAAESRAVIVVGKKVDKRAVVRNRIRRRLAADLASRWQTVPPGYDIVVSVHRDISALPPVMINQLLTTALQRSGVIAR